MGGWHIGISVFNSDRSCGSFDIFGMCTKRQNHGRVRCESTLYHGVLFLLVPDILTVLLDFLWIGMNTRVVFA